MLASVYQTSRLPKLLLCSKHLTKSTGLTAQRTKLKRRRDWNALYTKTGKLTSSLTWTCLLDEAGRTELLLHAVSSPSPVPPHTRES